MLYLYSSNWCYDYNTNAYLCSFEELSRHGVQSKIMVYSTHIEKYTEKYDNYLNYKESTLG